MRKLRNMQAFLEDYHYFYEAFARDYHIKEVIKGIQNSTGNYKLEARQTVMGCEKTFYFVEKKMQEYGEDVDVSVYIGHTKLASLRFLEKFGGKFEWKYWEESEESEYAISEEKDES